MTYKLLKSGVLNLDTNEVVKYDLSSDAWQAYRQWLKSGNTPLPPDPDVVVPPTPEEIQAAVVLATQERLDAFARTRGYDGILSACTYATSAVPKFAAEGQYAVTARDSTWAALYQFLQLVITGVQPMPSGFSDVEPFLPTLDWPD